jgi:hypothetical protein
VATGEWPQAVTDADRLKHTVEVVVGYDDHRQTSPVPIVTEQVQHDFLYRTDDGAREGYVLHYSVALA